MCLVYKNNLKLIYGNFILVVGKYTPYFDTQNMKLHILLLW
jgi:hypothetical protein